MGCDSFNAATNDPFWYVVDVPFARIITYSTDSNYTEGSPQHAWLKDQLELANTAAERAVRPWVLLAGHKPM